MRKSAIVTFAAALLVYGLWVRVGLTEDAKKDFRPLPPPANFSPPVISIEQPDYDWGSVLQGEPARHDFVFANKGGAPLTITQVKASCGCTTAAKPEKPIEPGQTGIVTLEIDTKRFTGKIKKTADVFSNSLPNPIRISIGGNVESFYTMEPAAPRINYVRGLPPEPAKVTLRRNANTKVQFSVKEIATTSKIVQTKITEVQAGESYEIDVTANIGDDPKKYFYEPITIKMLVGGKDFDVPVSVSVTVKDRIDVQPRTSVYFSRNETKAISEPGAQPATKTLDIVSLGGKDHAFNITGVAVEAQPAPAAPGTTTPPVAPAAGEHYFDTKVETVEAGKHYRLNVLMSKLPDSKLRTVREKIVLQTDDPTVKEIAITAMAALQ